ncbi:TOM22 [Candida pseudojiufengensis]|uniref:TOM22 n=1 Tax=Candida pseudojiufengensis TaxID=497109 RepID=UPI002224CCA1|nr:TOM22 [Candida pseudojiufengensis]KAI5959848.1 TOM22 [Candida pseudojiufengensis]
MVKLTQIDDATQTTYPDGTTTINKVEINEFDESDSEFSDDEDDFDYSNETIYDRIIALKDIISPQQRDNISKFTSLISNYSSIIANKSGTLLWGLTSSSLLLGVPLALAILSETQLQEMEKDMSLQKSAQDVLAPGSEDAFGEKK